MEAPKPETMTGANKILVCAFIVMKAVERYTTWAETIEGEEYDEEHAADVLADRARAFAEANLASRVHSAGEKAAALALKQYDALTDCAAMHIIHGTGASVMQAELEEEFLDSLGLPMVAVPQPVSRPARKRRAASGTSSATTLERVQLRAQGIIDLLWCPPNGEALRGLSTLLGSDCLRQCLPLLPPAPGTEPSVAWLDKIADQGPFTQGHWLLVRLRSRVGDTCDSGACWALARAIVDGFRDALKTTTIYTANGPNIHHRLLVPALNSSFV